MLTQNQSRMASLLPDNGLAPASAVACLDAKPRVSLGVVSEGTAAGLTGHGESIRIVVAVAQEVAAEGKICAAPLVEKVVAAFPRWSKAPTAGPEEVAVWANRTALAIAGGEIAYQRALEVARSNDFAESAGLLPAEVAEAVRDKWADQEAGEFETVWEIRTWAGVVAKHYIIDQQRHLGVEHRVEKLADQVAPMFHAAMPFPPASTPIQLRDVLEQALIIAVNLASRKPARRARRRPERRTNLLVMQFWVQFLASMFGYPLGGASELAAMLETTRGTVYTNRVKIQRRVLDLQRAGKIDLDLPTGRSKPKSKSKREPRI